MRTRSCTGPSPRTWGLPHPKNPGTSPTRSIPTCVGTTSPSRTVSWMRSVHPHVRGDYGLPEEGLVITLGPSPRAWGLLGRPGLRSVRRRSIPTCVGTTRTCTSCLCTPRGPSPRAWGLRCRSASGGVRRRSIPTCVGTTVSNDIVPKMLTVHPHVRGDYPTPFPPRVGKRGPSPRAWGLLHRPHRGHRPARSIPTCVGTTR